MWPMPARSRPAPVPETDPPAPDWLTHSLDRVRARLTSGGVAAALAFLNERVPHRFTGIYRFQAEAVRNVFLHDKLNMPQGFVRGVPREDSFCRFIQPSTPFHVVDSAADARLAGHRYRGVVGAYYGVALSGTPGVVVGSLCHFDFGVLVMPPGEAVLLQRAASLLLGCLNGFEV
ncbi:MAG: hypothetical protein JWQ72_1426 [Polaromonas sp.]|nr:hypothetical protein [Polaromonas sp.]